jgi:SAM-dependent methyltransferase
MTRNVYDDPEFFANYGRLGRSTAGLEGAPEWPSLRAMLPDLRGLRVVDLGCGYGWFCRWARAAGAAQLLGIDISERMLERARADTSDPAIAYRRADLEGLDLPAAAFDLAYSSLALHYIADLGRLLATVHAALVAGGALVCSIEHPIYTAPLRPGWAEDGSWPLDHYLVEGSRQVQWLGRVVHKYHRTLGTWLNLLQQRGFGIVRVEEWRPTEAQIAARPELAQELQRPMFLLLSARRQGP